MTGLYIAAVTSARTRHAIGRRQTAQRWPSLAGTSLVAIPADTPRLFFLAFCLGLIALGKLRKRLRQTAFILPSDKCNKSGAFSKLYCHDNRLGLCGTGRPSRQSPCNTHRYNDLADFLADLSKIPRLRD